MADVVVTLTVPLDRLPGLSALIKDYIDSDAAMSMEVETVEDTRRPARSADWQAATREFFKRYPDGRFSTGDIASNIIDHGVRIDRATVSRYLSKLVEQGYLKPEGEGRYRRYQINPLTMKES
jgi:DNA-binding transcriptional ArsR family regulator